MRMFSDWRSWKSWRNLVIAFIVLWLVDLGAMKGIAWYSPWQLAKDSPQLAVMPTALPDTGVADLENGTAVEAFGYSLRVPWAKASKQIFRTIAIFGNADGTGRLVIFNDPGHVDSIQLLRKNGSMRAELEKVMSAGDLSSPYQLFKAEMESSPAEMRFWHSRQTNSRDLLLLIGKGQFAREGTTAIYPVEGGELRGYEALEAKDGHVSLKLFDERGDQLELELLLPKPGSGETLTQAQINAVVASIKSPDKGCLTPGHCG